MKESPQEEANSTHLSIVIPFRAADEYRLKNLQNVLSNLETIFLQAELVLVEQSTKPQLPLLHSQSDTKIEHVVIEDDGPFNKSLAINKGVEKSSNDIFLVCDADMILDGLSLTRSFDAMQKGINFIRPFSYLIDLDLEQTEEYCVNNSLPTLPKEDESIDRSHLGEGLCLAGGAFFTNKEFYKRVGGFDERFEGWGGEDNAFSIKVERNTRNALIIKDTLAWHLWHPRHNVDHTPEYLNNRQLLIDVQFEGLLVKEKSTSSDL